jgi:hypothetical protein
VEKLTNIGLFILVVLGTLALIGLTAWMSYMIYGDEAVRWIIIPV